LRGVCRLREQVQCLADARLFNYIPSAVKQGLAMFPPFRRISDQVMKDL